MSTRSDHHHRGCTFGSLPFDKLKTLWPGNCPTHAYDPRCRYGPTLFGDQVAMPDELPPITGIPRGRVRCIVGEDQKKRFRRFHLTDQVQCTRRVIFHISHKRVDIFILYPGSPIRKDPPQPTVPFPGSATVHKKEVIQHWCGEFNFVYPNILSICCFWPEFSQR